MYCLFLYPLIVGLGDTGAALSMSRELTEANGGRIWVDSVIDAGSAFSVLFPISKPQSDADEPVPNLAAPAGGNA